MLSLISRTISMVLCVDFLFMIVTRDLTIMYLIIFCYNWSTVCYGENKSLFFSFDIYKGSLYIKYFF